MTAVAIVFALTSPAVDAVVRTLWRDIGDGEEQVKALHAYDSILEETGFLAGPALASVLMLLTDPSSAMLISTGLLATGYFLVLLSSQVRSALRPRNRPLAKPPATRPGGRLRRVARTLAGPIASRELQRIVAPLIVMGTVFGAVGITAPALTAAYGNSAYTGFVLAAISLGGTIGALVYSSVQIRASLRIRHAALGVVFACPMLLAFTAVNPWLLGGLLALSGLAVAPLYINAYLMMDSEIPDDVIHEANTWVPAGNNVGYMLGLTIGAALLEKWDASAVLVTISVVAAALLTHSLADLYCSRRLAPPASAAEEVPQQS